MGMDSMVQVYFSVLAKSVGNVDQVFKNAITSLMDSNISSCEQIIYDIWLPGSPKLGEGKPENQNHAIIFSRGECLQTIDMNQVSQQNSAPDLSDNQQRSASLLAQDNYLEEDSKMRNLLQEFKRDHGIPPPTTLDVHEHIFTRKVHFHYGHPDVFDRIFHITRGGISKASRGFNSTLRCGNVTYHEYIQVGKGRVVGINQISLIEAKVASGNGEQMLTRDMYCLGQRLDLVQMLSCYFTMVGFYISSRPSSSRHIRPTERTGRALHEPLINAISVEAVIATREDPTQLPPLEIFHADRAVASTPSNRETVDRPGRPDGTLKDECLDVDEEITYAIDDLVSDPPQAEFLGFFFALFSASSNGDDAQIKALDVKRSNRDLLLQEEAKNRAIGEAFPSRKESLKAKKKISKDKPKKKKKKFSSKGKEG
ncbi:Callose synthase 5 [Acorus gramineus]|uniref:Callose synthase 5 n=1 Tax=Acorus gramineus TaxID=55184 RepID=A0AAV9BE86_ACOGR|nr:Callose synthase 5 [Acorus gramineus]